MKKILNLTLFLIFNFSIFALPFNSKLSQEELNKLNDGEILIRNIDYEKNMCLSSEYPLAVELKNSIKSLSPKYLAEVIQIKPYSGNEDLPEKLEKLLLNVSDYAGIPYWSVRHQQFFDLYTSAEIKEIKKEENKTKILADLIMDPFGTVNESIIIQKNNDEIFYFSENLNTLNYLGKFDCVSPKKMNMDILLFRDGENWILYGIGGVKAPRIPFFTERIETSFIGRIKTFCEFIFQELK